MKHKVTIGILAAGVLYSQVSFAVWPVAVDNEMTFQYTPIVQAIAQARSAIVDAINKLAQVVDGSSSKEVAALGEATKQIKDGQAESLKYNQIYNAREKTELPPDACATGQASLLAGQVAAATEQMASRYRGMGAFGRNPVAANPGGNPDVARRLAYSPRSPEEALGNTLALHGNHYCSAEDASYYGSAACPGGTSRFPDGDVDVRSLFAGAGDTGPNFAFTPEQIDAARAYTRNLIDPINSLRLTKKEASYDAGKAYLAMQATAAARYSLAEKPLVDALASRTPTQGLKGVLEELAQCPPENQQCAARQYYLANKDRFAGGVSELGLIEFEVGRRYMNPAWLVEISKQTAGNPIDRERIIMQALQLDLLRRQYLKMESIESLLGATYANQTRIEMDPKLQAQYRAVYQIAAKSK